MKELFSELGSERVLQCETTTNNYHKLSTEFHITADEKLRLILSEEVYNS